MVIENDRGLPFSRIEKIVKIFIEKRREANARIRDKIRYSTRNEMTPELYEKFGLQEHKKAIDELDKQINELKEKRKEYEEAIRAKTQCITNRYSDYSVITSGSEIYNYLHQKDKEIEFICNRIKDLCDDTEEKLWLAADIEQARAIIEEFNSSCDMLEQEIKKLTKG